MEHSWRPRPSPPIQGNICPTCSISHFPFCPPPYLSFNQNPDFLTHDNSRSFQRPLLDPFLGHSTPNINLHRPFLENPDDLFVDPRPWHRNPSCEDSGRFNEGHGDGLASYRYDRTGTGFKRTRVDEMGRGSFVNDYPMNFPSFSMDNERRLKLIRDHGGLASDRETEAYLQENTGSDRAFGSIGGVETGRFNEWRGGINGMTLKPPTNYEMNDFRDPRFGDFDKNGSYFHAEPVSNAHKHVEEHGLASGQENFRSSRDNEELGKSQYGQANGHIHIRQWPDYHEGGIQYNSIMGGSYSPSVSYSSALHHQRGSSFSTENHDPSHHLSQAYVIQNPVQLNHDIHSDGQVNDSRGNKYFNEQDVCVSSPSNNRIPVHTSRMINAQRPLSDSPSPPLPVVPSSHLFIEHHALSSPAITASSLFPIAVSSAVTVPSPYASVAEANSVVRPYFHDRSCLHASSGFSTDGFRNNSSTKYLGHGQPRLLKSSDKPTSVDASHIFKPTSVDASHIFKPKSVDASHIFKHPHRATRPDHIVIILRGLPGSGKSYLAKMLRDLEVENGGDAPRIHSMDEYFMTEIEKLEESDVSKSSSSARGKKPVMKKVMEYCYEPEMEEAYRSSMLKAFKKTLDEGAFSFVLVDDRNLRVADFAQFWAIAKRSGYEVYLAESQYKDPVGCAARNVHGFTRDAIEKMAGLWEEVPSLYLKLDTKSLFQGDDLKESEIQEVDMDTEDEDSARVLPSLEERNEITELPLHDYLPDGSFKDDEKWEAEGEHLKEEVKELGRSKWSRDLDDENAKRTKATKGNLGSLSRLIKAYAMEGKSVHWGDQVGNTGFSIGVTRQVYASLVIGPGAGYNLISNPLHEEHCLVQHTTESKGQNVFQERIRAERESFRAVFDKKRDRIRGVEV